MSSNESALITVSSDAALLLRLRQGMQQVIVGADRAVELLLVALLAGGHALLDDVPGTGKTTLAKTLARVLDCSFARVQFTPDLLPGDVTGSSVFNQQTAQFERRPGPVFTQILLADEINRAGPRTQAALLEAMEERQVTIDGVTLPLPAPFFVIATQNPIELEGTFPLPEAQLDRFLLSFRLGYPSEAEERAIARRFRADQPLLALRAFLSAAEVLTLQAQVRQVRVDEAVEDYAIAVCRATRQLEVLQLGASPRGTLALLHAAQARALLSGRRYVLPDDIKTLAAPVLAHRLVLRTQTRLRGRNAAQIISDLLATIPTPVDNV
ncbi:MAG TPA: MoxR family ATPase [Chloroflexota bacterium]|nr:MoxR family ATPase [Chloroflexota bacterium]